MIQNQNSKAKIKGNQGFKSIENHGLAYPLQGRNLNYGISRLEVTSRDKVQSF